MQNFGPQTLAIGAQTKYYTGVGWEYLTVINESPYLLDANFSGIGSISIPAWFSDDVRIPSGYTGQIVLTPNNYLGLTQIVSQLVAIIGWIPGELGQRQSVGLSQNFGNVVTATATNLVNDGSPVGTTIIESTELGSSGSNIVVKNDGTVGIFQYVAGTLTQLFSIIPGVASGALNNNVILGDAARSVLVNGSLQANNTIWGYNGIVGVTGATNLNAITANITTNSTSQGVVILPVALATNFTDIVANGNGTNAAGIGLLANALLTGIQVLGSQTGLQISGLSSIAGIDLGGLSAGGGPAIIMPNLPMRAKSGNDLLLDTVTTTDSIRLKNNGSNIMSILTSGVTVNSGLLTALVIDPNAASFFSQAGSVSGTCIGYMPFQGSAFKFVIVVWNNYQDASTRSFALPTAFVNNLMFYIPSDIGVTTNGGIQFLIGATAQQCGMPTALAVAGGTGANTVSPHTVFKYSIGAVNAAALNPIDHIAIVLNTGAHSGIAFLVGN